MGVVESRHSHFQCLYYQPLEFFMSTANQRSPFTLPPDEFSALAGKLQETAEILRACRPPVRSKSVTRDASGGETRCYYFSPAVLQHEQKLLRQYRATDFCDLLTETHALMAGLVKIMKSTHPDARLRGTSICSLGHLLEKVSALTLKMRNVYSRVEQIRA